MKKVLMIEDNDDSLNVAIHEIMKARTIRAARRFIEGYGSPSDLLASFEAEVGSVFGHYTEDPKGDQVELKIVAIPDDLEGEQIEKGKEYHVLILACADKRSASTDKESEVKK